MYWGPVDRSNNLGLWENNMSLGQKGIGVGSLQISGLTPGETVFYNVQAKGTIFSDWSDQSGKLITVSPPIIESLPANKITQDSATIRGNVTSNGGSQ